MKLNRLIFYLQYLRYLEFSQTIQGKMPMPKQQASRIGFRDLLNQKNSPNYHYN